MTKPAPVKEPDEKQFSLKQIETNVLANINARHNAELLDFLTFVAIERLAYNVTESTRFRTDGEGHVFISEVAPEQPAEEVVTA